MLFRLSNIPGALLFTLLSSGTAGGDLATALTMLLALSSCEVARLNDVVLEKDPDAGGELPSPVLPATSVVAAILAPH